MSAFANLLVLVVRLDLEAEFATIHLEQFSAYRHLLAFRRGAEVLDVHLEAYGGVPFGEMRLYGRDAGTLHQTDHRWRGQDAVAPHVPDHQLVIDFRHDLRFEPWRQVIRRHESLSRIERRALGGGDLPHPSGSSSAADAQEVTYIPHSTHAA